MEGMKKKQQQQLKTKMDYAIERRRARQDFLPIQLQLDHCLMKIPYEGLKIEESYEKNSRGIEIFSKSWLPERCSPKALVCFCHGYGETCTFAFEGIARKLGKCGYGVIAMDYPGFGLSEGLHGYIPSLDQLVNDVAEHFSKLKDNMIPPWIILQILIGIAHLFPKLKIVPNSDFVKMAFRDFKKRKMAACNVIAYRDRARVGTALECLRTTQELEQRLEEVSIPLLILHGEADVVTDPSVSKALYEKAKSSDKKLKLYKDAFHSLLEGETDDVIFQVLHDIISWLDLHSTQL